MASAAEAEIGGIFHNRQSAVPLRHTLIEMGHPQPPTLIQTDNSTALGYVNSSIKIKRTKAMDMRFHWIKDRISQKEFLVYWRSGLTYLGDYFTKHFSPAHHIVMRPKYLHQALHLMNQVVNTHSLRGCANNSITNLDTYSLNSQSRQPVDVNRRWPDLVKIFEPLIRKSKK